MHECLIYICVYATQLNKNFITIDSTLYSLVWNDEFTEQDSSHNWITYNPGLRRDAINTPSAIKVEDGKLKITTSFNKNGPPNTGMIRTKKEFTNGYFETKVRFQKHTGHWSAFWLQSINISRYLTPGQGGVEFDIFEYRASQNDIVQTAIHWGGYRENHKASKKSLPISRSEEEWVTIGGLWTEIGWSTYVNGRKLAEFDMVTSNLYQYIVLSLEVDSWAGDIPKFNLQDSVEFEYIRVYQKTYIPLR